MAFSIKEVARRLDINRNTLYYRFKKTKQSLTFVKELGEVLHHDFSEHFPKLKSEKEDLDRKAKLFIKRQKEKILENDTIFRQKIERYKTFIQVIANLAAKGDLKAIKRKLKSFSKEN